MILADVNVLVSALRQDAPHHVLCKAWYEDALNRRADFGVAPLVLSAVIRITTNRRIYDPPSKTAEAIDFCDFLLTLPNAHRIEPGQRHWEIFTDLCRQSDVRGALVTDAWFAALAIEHGCEWITLDRDFARFKSLRWKRPALSQAG